MCKPQFITFDAVRASAAAAGLFIARPMRGLPGVYEIPSSTSLNTAYTVTLAGPHAVCSCLDGGDHCWHVARARELDRAAVAARGQAAADLLFGGVAA